MVVKKVVNYESYILIGLLMVVLTIGKLIFGFKIDSDWFWFIAGVALVLEGGIDFAKQRQFNKKYKVVLREEYKKNI